MGDAVRFSVDSADLRGLYVALKDVEGNLRVELRRGVTAAAQPVAARVRGNASWSSRIPGAVKVKTSFSAKAAGVLITVDARKAPEARPLEHGGKPGKFRHPVFADPGKTRADWTWVNQPARPFFAAAAQSSTSGVMQAIVDVMNTVWAKAGFR